MKNEETKEPLCDDIAGKDCGLKRVIDTVGVSFSFHPPSYIPQYLARMS